MGILAVLMGLSVGMFTSTGTETQLTQARAILRETAFRVKSASEGGGRQGTLLLQRRTLNDGSDVMQVGALVGMPALTHQFETIEDASSNISVRMNGEVKRVDEGYHGSAALFQRGSFLEIPGRSRFAMTEGVQIDVRIKPEPDGQEMVILRAEDDIYRLSLIRPRQQGNRYGVKWQVKVFAKGQNHRSHTPEQRTFETEGAPVRAGAAWQRIQVSFDGLDASIRVNGIEHMAVNRKRRKRDASLDEANVEALRTIAIPARGAAKLFISDGSASFEGLIDSLKLRGVYRSDEMQRDLPADLELLGAKLPVRVVYLNGRLDPDVHQGDVVLHFRLRDERLDADPQDLPIELRLGMNGTIETKLAQPTQAQGTRSAGTGPKKEAQ